MDKMYGFERLEVWSDARKFVKNIYTITKSFPSEEKFGLVSQMQRAAVSVASNISEGISRFTSKEKCRFIEISYGSLMEVYCQLCIAVDLEYLTHEQLQNIKPDIDKISNKLSALRRHYNIKT